MRAAHLSSRVLDVIIASREPSAVRYFGDGHSTLRAAHALNYKHIHIREYYYQYDPAGPSSRAWINWNLWCELLSTAALPVHGPIHRPIVKPIHGPVLAPHHHHDHGIRAQPEAIGHHAPFGAHGVRLGGQPIIVVSPPTVAGPNTVTSQVNIDGELLSTSAVSSNDIWAIGGNLVEQFKGTTWSVVPSGALPAGDSASFSDVNAVASNGTSTEHPLIIQN